MTSSLTSPHALVGELQPSQPAHQQPRYFAPAAPVVEDPFLGLQVEEGPVIEKVPTADEKALDE